MKRVLLIGNSPLPNENTPVRPAAGLRTWQFLKALERHCVLKVVTIAMPECYGGASVTDGLRAEATESGEQSSHKQRDELTAEQTKRQINLKTERISKDDPNLLKILQAIHDEFQPEAIVSVNTYPSYIACCLNSHAPLWCDLNGWIMAEAQAQAYKMDSNDYLKHYFGMESAVVKRADKLSAVSRAEGFALLGELACCGRLNKESFGYKFVEYVPNGIEWFDGEVEALEDGSQKPKIERESVPGHTLPKDSFILLWVGGYNTWVDEITLFKAVNDAIKKCESLYFVSTGGEIKGLDNQTFAKFKKLIEESAHRDRFVFLGWVDTNEIPLLYKRAQAGINVDRRCVETMTGARNRINEMMKFGLPVITTLGSEISEEVARIGAGIAVKSGDHLALTQAICAMYEEWRGGGGRETPKFKQYGKNGQDYIRTFCNYETTVKPLIEWLTNPRPAPDKNVKVKLGGAGGVVKGLFGFNRVFGPGGLPGLKAMWRYLKQNGFKKSFQKFLQKMRK